MHQRKKHKSQTLFLKKTIFVFMKRAIIDLGTNTCNLLIAEVEKSNYQILHTSKESVKLGKGGISNKLLTPEATERAIHALQTHLRTIQGYGEMNSIEVIATSAVRDALNKDNFAQQLKDATNLNLNIIDGDQEASYIFDGVKLAIENIPDGTLIMDIGGGSNEFIFIKNNEIAWKQSFPTGIARVVEQFHISNPILISEAQEISRWFEAMMPELWKLQENKINVLIGSSGTFDTIADSIDQISPNSTIRKAKSIAISDFEQFFQVLIKSSFAERLAMPTIEEMRVEMIVPALILIDLVLKKLSIPTIIQTDYSLKEGVLAQFLKPQL